MYDEDLWESSCRLRCGSTLAGGQPAAWAKHWVSILLAIVASLAPLGQAVAAVPSPLPPLVTPETQAAIDRGLEPKDRFAIAPRRPSRWRMGWSAGAGVCFDIHGRATACGAVVWGVQF